MSRIKELRNSLEKRLDALEQQALALEAQLTQSMDEGLRRLEERKRRLSDVLKQVHTEVEGAKDLAEQARTSVKAALDRLLVQLALGRADARDAVEEQRGKIARALEEFESLADEKLKDAVFQSGRIWEELVERANQLQAEFDSLKTRFESEQAKQRGALESKKGELLDKLRAYKEQLSEKRRTVQAKTDAFEVEMRDALEHIKAAFRRLFD